MAPLDCLLQCSMTMELTTECINDPCKALANKWDCCHQSNIRLALLTVAATSLVLMTVLFGAKLVNVYRRRHAAMSNLLDPEHHHGGSVMKKEHRQIKY
jgi:hypothetical protein